MEYVYDINTGELYHYGVKGMKWGVRRANKRAYQNERYAKKAAKFDLKAAKARRKSEKAHDKYDLGGVNRAKRKSAKYATKAARLDKKLLGETNESTAIRMERKSAKLKYKAAKLDMKGNSLSRTTGYGIRAEAKAKKADKYAQKAAKARYEIANNKRFVDRMKTKVSNLSPEEYAKGKEYFDEFLKRAS